MGCCMSTEHRRAQDENRRRGGGGAPLPRSPPVEEAVVKEVLSETRIVPKVADGFGSKGTPTRDQAWKVDFRPASALGRGNGRHTSPRRVNQERKSNGGGKEGEDVVSDASELFSYSGSYSNNAATAAERRDKGHDEDGVVEQRPRPRKLPAAAAGRGRGERVQGRKQAAASPERKGQVVPPRPGRGRSASAGRTRNVADERGTRRDTAEGSGRRSRTPDRRVDGGRGRRNGGEDKGGAVGRGPPNDVVKADEETLENPVVSLECFIFL